jgi:hypothetical protein
MKSVILAVKLVAEIKIVFVFLVQEQHILTFLVKTIVVYQIVPQDFMHSIINVWM